jgi:nicotinate-nucleotide pyrophosphorylase (carboxylating)
MREFSDIEVIYSSIVYLYDVGQVVSYIMKTFLATGTFSDSLIQASDAKVAVWHSLLPACKRDPLRQDGRVDEVMFLAHLVGAIITMNVHRPFSSLVYSVEELSTESFVSPVPFIEPLKQGRAAHTARSLKAVEMQTKLLSIPCRLEMHNLFTLCIVASIATAQISACNILLDDHALSIARDRLRLAIGFLNQMGSLWPLAKKMAKEVRYIARQTLAAGTINSAPEPGPTQEIEIPRDDLIWPVDPCTSIDIYSGIVLPLNWDNNMYQSSSTSSTLS